MTTTVLDDFNAKLVVLETLCHDLEILPAYMPESDPEWDRIDESALAYYRALVIPDEALAQVTALTFDGGLQIYQDIWPGWDGEDDYFGIRDHAPLAGLPALHTVWTPDPLPAEVRALYTDRGITIED
ncbi:DUF6892 domain-containing protein [Streptomyces sp. GC420]|uniref:DUF6892 domain-containing protein n=1 Tax=Streptomyces sp. GC420 TaxID=2697568 RepID=UPI00141520A3|nr:hypothetical protein [Streptomyces sp. GC420]NBM20080.1 hypothetical protein [Streptomyces sp. GC420]